MIVLLVLLLIPTLNASEICEYSYTVWNNRERKSEGPFTIRKPYARVTSLERYSSTCTICRRDQVEVSLQNGVRFEVCKSEAGKFVKVLEEALKAGFTIKTVVGYRPSLSKGPLDSTGRRTQFSRHAFGVAIDVNEDHNGLYDQCVRWGPACRLIKGGKYSATDPLSIRPDSILVKLFGRENLKWGGEIQGVQKDFMHFSPDGL